MSEKTKDVVIYTDGGCKPNPGPGGWGAVVLDASARRVLAEFSGHEERTTNNRMELTGATEALRRLEGPHRVRIVTDSRYVQQGITRWVAGWRRNGWQTGDKKPVKNRDLWEALDAELGRHEVTWSWTKGHAGNRWNEHADALATRARGGEAPTPAEEELEGALQVFTAAAFSARGRRGGWSAVIVEGDARREISGGCDGTTANQMHLQAVIEGLAALEDEAEVHVYTTSSYARDGATRWIAGWRRRGWVTGAGQAVMNRDLWEAMDDQQRRHRVVWHLVDKNASPEGMTRAKELATAATRPESPIGP